MAEIAASLATTLFLQPQVMRTFVRYILTSHTPLDELGDGRQQSRVDELASDTAAIAQALLRRPSGFNLVVQVGVLARDPTAKPRTQCLFYWDDSALAIPDTLLIDAKFHQVLVPLACMTADPGVFWTNVVHGGMGGHVVAKGFRFVPALVAAYSPPYAVALLAEAQLDALVGNIDADQLRVHGDFHVRAIGAGILKAVKKAAHLSATESGTIRALGKLLLDTHGDTAPTRERVKCLVRNLETLTLHAYATTRAQTLA